MKTFRWFSAGVMTLALLSVASLASAQGPNTWHPYVGAPNCIQVGDARGNFNCFAGITIDPVTGAVGGLAGGGTVSTSGSPANHQTSIFSSGAIITGVGPGTSGQVLMSNGAGSDPSYQTLTGGGNLSATSPTNHGVMLGQGSQNLGVTGAGSAGQVLTSNGASADPTFQAAGAGSGTVTSIATTAPLGGGTITTTGTLTCTTCLTATTPTSHGVLLGAGTQAVGATAAGSAGQVLTSNGASSDPTFQAVAGTGTVTTTGSPSSGQVSIMSGATSITSTSGLTSSAGALTATGAITGNGLVSNGATSGSLTLTNVGGNAQSVIIQVGNPTANRTWTWPIIDGSANQVLQTNGSGVLSFAAAAGGGTVTTTGSPANGNLSKFTGATSVSNADLSGDVTTSGGVATTLSAVNKRRTCMIVVGADNGAALADADIGPQLDQCYVPYAATVVEVFVKADAGTPSALPQVRSVANSPTNLLSGALATAASGARACSNTGGTTGLDATTTCTNTLTTTALAAGTTLGVTSGTAGGTAKRMSVAITYTVN